jgi:cation transport ATPase
MESSPKEQKSRCQDNPDEKETHSDTDVSHDSQSPELSQLALMNQWRCNLNSLLEDLEIPACDSFIDNQPQDITPEIAEKLDYLKQTDVLLQQYDDFALSGSGFEKYKAAHLTVVDFLTQLHLQKEKQKQNQKEEQEKKQREQEKEKKTVRFYFFSRKKHINQQEQTIPWLFTFFHLILLLSATAALVVLGTFATVVTQNNGVVAVLLFITLLAIIRASKNKIRNYRNSASTPIRFIISLFSICSLVTVLYALVFIVIPVRYFWDVKPFLRDDIIIIGLGLFSFIIFSHAQNSRKQTAKFIALDQTDTVSEDVIKVSETVVAK